jgi:hypothetical protein
VKGETDLRLSLTTHDCRIKGWVFLEKSFQRRGAKRAEMERKIIPEKILLFGCPLRLSIKAFEFVLYSSSSQPWQSGLIGCSDSSGTEKGKPSSLCFRNQEIDP